MKTENFDIVIIGAGAAGSQLALAMGNDPWFSDRRVLVIDKDPKEAYDRTWCFWEKGVGSYDEILYHSWGKGAFTSKAAHVELAMEEYRYKMLRSSDFYRFAKEGMDRAPNVEFRVENVLEVRADGTVETDQCHYRAERIFDSRVPDEFRQDTASVKLLQHFLGWTIRTSEPVFDPDSFVMMDYRSNQETSCSFNYVLPFSADTALIEFTLFSSDLLEKEEYEHYLRGYIENEIGCRDFEILDNETGVIPMSDYPFYKHHSGKISKIGTGGGWVKPSSGYSFRNSQRYIESVVNNMKAGKVPHAGIGRGRARLFDSIFIGILEQQNWRGEELFETMFTKLPAPLIFRFLDETTKFGEDLRVLSAYLSPTFIKAFFRRLFR